MSCFPVTIGVSAGLADIGVQRQRAQHDLNTGLRDIRQGIDAGMENATNNAVQRGIYDSGVRQENQDTVQREGAEAESDLRADINFRLQSLSARASGLRESLAAAGSAAAAQRSINAIQSQGAWNDYLASVLGQYGVDFDAIVAQMQGLPQSGAGGGVNFQ